MQVINATYSTQTTTASASYSDTGLTASITPAATGNKVLVTANLQIFKGSTNTYVGLKLFRGATEIALLGTEFGFTGAADGNNIGTVAISYLDSPNTTSSTAYKVQFNSGAGSGTAYVNAGTGMSTITLMEIGA